MQNNTDTLENGLSVLNKAKPFDAAILLPDIYPREIKIYIHARIYMGMFIAALFIPTKPRG
jgi:hypothetical protein